MSLFNWSRPLRALGHGSYSVVVTDGQYAAKVFQDGNEDSLLNEVHAYLQTNVLLDMKICPFFLRFYGIGPILDQVQRDVLKGSFEDVKNLSISGNCLILEKGERSLEDVISILTEEEAWSIFVQLIIAVSVMRDHFYHNDLYSQNILLTSVDQETLTFKTHSGVLSIPTYGYLIKICDYGIADFYGGPSSSGMEVVEDLLRKRLSDQEDQNPRGTKIEDLRPTNDGPDAKRFISAWSYVNSVKEDFCHYHILKDNNCEIADVITVMYAFRSRRPGMSRVNQLISDVVRDLDRLEGDARDDFCIKDYLEKILETHPLLEENRVLTELEAEYDLTTDHMCFLNDVEMEDLYA